MIDIIPVHPGEILCKNHMVVRKSSIESLAEELGVSAEEIENLIYKKTSVSIDMSKRLGKLFGNDDELWLRLQKKYESDLEITEKGLSPPKQIWELFSDKREALLTAMVASGEDVFYGSVWIHKLMFSLNKIVERKSDRSLFHFSNGDYGVTCDGIYSLLRECQADGYIRIISAKAYHQKHDQYKIEEKGRETGQNCLNKLPADAADYIKKTAEWAHGCNFKDLVGTFYAMYPSTQTNSKISKTSNNRKQILVSRRILHRRQELYERITDE